MFGLIRKMIVFILFVIIALAVTVYFCNLHIQSQSKEFLYDRIEDVPETDVALVPGTVSTVRGGAPNLYFKYRMDAAVQLYKAGKVKHFILSGDNRTKYYNEPEDMRAALIAAGIPDTCITLDYAGFRTLDSVVRCWKIFGKKKVLIVSQKFHNERAVFLARRFNMEPIAFNAQDVSESYGAKTKSREYLARVKAYLDIYILKTKPKFLGEEIELPI